MSDAVVWLDKPQADEMYMLLGWRQWADAGSMSSLLPKYLIQNLNAKKIATIKPDGFYLFQIPGTHDLVRPLITFEEGYPVSLETKRNDFYYAESNGRGLIIFLGDEPHLDIERYVAAILDMAKTLNVKRMVSFGGVYAEVPYDKERTVSCAYSAYSMKEELKALALSFTDYQGGAAIGSYLCRRAADNNMQYVGLYAFVPAYDFSILDDALDGFRIDNDFRAWLGVLRRVDHMLSLKLDFGDLETRVHDLNLSIEEKVRDLHRKVPQVGVKRYLERLSELYEETVFDPPLGDVWADELDRLFEDDDSDASTTDDTQTDA